MEKKTAISKRLTKVQKNVLAILKNGGRIFLFEDGSTGLDDADGNTIRFNSKTFDALIEKSCLAVSARPNICTEIYTINRIGASYLTPPTT